MGTAVEVPEGALRLLFGPSDTFFSDNRDGHYEVLVKQYVPR